MLTQRRLLEPGKPIAIHAVSIRPLHQGNHCIGVSPDAIGWTRRLSDHLLPREKYPEDRALSRLRFDLNVAAMCIDYGLDDC